MREPLVMLLEQAGAEVTCATSNPDELLIYLARDQPDVVVTDLKMPPTKTDEGVQVAKWVKANYPDTGVLVLSAYNETSQAAQLVDSDMRGVGYLLKDNVTDAKDLYRALTRVLAGEQVVDPDVVERLMGSRRRAEEIERLSAQERKVLGYMAEGYTDGEIAELLSISARTASDHVRSIFQKLDIDSAPGNNKRVKAVLRWLRVDNT
jgi:DNA-binding NarL/FixJ family response regulator